MKPWLRVLVVPLIVLALWLVPGEEPSTQVAGALEVAPVATALDADASPAPSIGPASSIVEALASVATAESSSTTTAGTPSSTTQTTTTVASTTLAPTTAAPTTTAPTTAVPTTLAPTTLAPTTLAPTTTAAVATTSARSLGEQALQRVSFDWRGAFPNWRIEFLGPRSGLRALTYPSEKRIEVFVRTSDSAASLHRVVAHELGHVIDVERNSASDRDRWLAQRGLDAGTTWWPDARSPDFATGAGDFAEAFAVWETGITTRSTIAGQPTSADLDVLRELFRG